MRLFLLWTLLACQEDTPTDCGSLTDREEADACHYSQLQTQIRAKDLEGSQASISSIESPMLASAAVHELFQTWQGEGLDLQRAMTLCESLDVAYQASCKQTWDRPHLWIEAAGKRAAGEPRWPKPEGTE
jgi:hypothetical protein